MYFILKILHKNVFFFLFDISDIICNFVEVCACQKSILIFYNNAYLHFSLLYRSRRNRSWNLLLLYTKMLSQETLQRWQEGIKGRGRSKVRAAFGQHVQRQGMYSVCRDFM